VFWLQLSACSLHSLWYTNCSTDCVVHSSSPRHAEARTKVALHPRDTHTQGACAQCTARQRLSGARQRVCASSSHAPVQSVTLRPRRTVCSRLPGCSEMAPLGAVWGRASFMARLELAPRAGGRASASLGAAAEAPREGRRDDFCAPMARAGAQWGQLGEDERRAGRQVAPDER